MKISIQQKEKNRQALLRAAVAVISGKGYEQATLREISAASGLSDPAVYGYFENKPSILYAYLLDSLERALAKVAKVSNATELSFNDQAQLLMEAHLEILEPDRRFVREIFPLIFVTGLSTAQEALLPCRNRFAEYVDQCLEESLRVGEFPPPPMRELLVNLFWDFHVGILHYWLRDESEFQLATREMRQKSLDAICELLKSQFLPRLVDLGYFLIRTHLLSPALAMGAGSRSASPPGKTKRRPNILESFDG